MSGFSSKQVRSLRRKLDRRHVQSRECDGRTLDYVEGWFAIAEANAIFGFDGWDREMTHFERLYERNRNDRISCGYLARIRIRVRAGENVIVREGTGWGSATAALPAEAHERALKAAETDATKRALATFGNRFGLGLYDKEQNGVTPKKPNEQPAQFCLYQPDGEIFIKNLSPEGFCSGLRQLIEKIQTLPDIKGVILSNEGSLVRLRQTAPNLKSGKGIHYADILMRLANDRMSTVAIVSDSTHSTFSNASAGKEPTTEGYEPAHTNPNQLPSAASLLKPSKIAQGPRIDKSELMIGTERRFRDKTHLQFVASKPCLVCGRQPTQAHHLKFAQQRGVSLKVSDEFTVPLCALHHDACHRSGDERTWWDSQGHDPLPIATALWTDSRTGLSTTNSGPITGVLEQVPAGGDPSDLAPPEEAIATLPQPILSRADSKSDEICRPAGDWLGDVLQLEEEQICRDAVAGDEAAKVVGRREAFQG